MLLLLTMVIGHVNGASTPNVKIEDSQAAKLENIHKRLMAAAMRFPNLSQDIQEHKDGRPLTPDRNLEANGNYVLTREHRNKFSSLRISTTPETSPDTSPSSSPDTTQQSSPSKLEKKERLKK